MSSKPFINLSPGKNIARRQKPSRLRQRLSPPLSLSRLLLFALLFSSSAAIVRSQQFAAAAAAPPVTDKLPPQSRASASPTPSPEEDEDFIEPARPGISNPAEFQRPGVLQLEYGYDSDFRARDFRAQQSLPLALRFAASSRVLLEVDLDTLSSETDEMRTRRTGIGDTRIGLQMVALKDTAEHPALSFAYYVKLPSASSLKGLGTGRVDHKVVLLLSKKVGETELDFNAAYLITGREMESGWVTGGLYAFAVAHEFENHFGLQAELSGLSKDDEQPRGLYALGALTYKANRRLVLDTGMRFGLNPDAPRFGVFAGLTVGVANLYRKSH
jgi:hypothetical protein